MKTITYFSGARSGNDPIYEDAAKKVGEFLGRKNCFIKYGASRTGLMGAFCFSFLSSLKESGSGAKIFGILPRKYVNVNRPETLGIEFIITNTLADRKEKLLKDADVILVMPGGIGTLDEIFETIEIDYLPADRDPTITEYHIRPIYILNINGYYRHMQEQLKHMLKEGFLIERKIENIFYFDTVDEYIKALDNIF